MGRGTGASTIRAQTQDLARKDGPVDLYLDDDLVYRPTPSGYVRAVTVAEAIAVMKAHHVRIAELDHDLGEGEPEGYRFVDWMAEHNNWPSQEIIVHSQNGAGAERMCGTIERYAPHLRRIGRSRRFSSIDGS